MATSINKESMAARRIRHYRKALQEARDLIWDLKDHAELDAHCDRCGMRVREWIEKFDRIEARPKQPRTESA